MLFVIFIIGMIGAGIIIDHIAEKTLGEEIEQMYEDGEL